MATKIDFTSVFATAQNVAEVNNLMATLVEGVLKEGHARIDSLSSGKGRKAKTAAKVEAKGKVEPTKKSAKTEGKTKVERKSADERSKERAAYIKACKPGTSVEVTIRDFRTKKETKKKIEIPTKAQVKKLKLKAVDYSDHSFVVMGGTKEIKDYLKHVLGGTFNSYLDCGAGWVFAKNEQGEAVKKALAI